MSEIRRLARKIPFAERAYGKAWAIRTYGPRLMANPRLALRFLLLDPEVANYTYDIQNLDELAEFVSSALGCEKVDAQSWLRELEADEDLRADLSRLLRTRRDRKSRPMYGRRAGWYAVVRALKPALVIETGVADGLGSSVLLQALARNCAEGAPGRLIGIDVDPASGWLVPGRLREHFTLLIEDSKTALRRIVASERIDVFIHDSDHHYAHELAEFQLIAPALAPNGVILTDNAHVTDALATFSSTADRRFSFWHERPRDHFYPGGGIGISAGKRLR